MLSEACWRAVSCACCFLNAAEKVHMVTNSFQILLSHYMKTDNWCIDEYDQFLFSFYNVQPRRSFTEEQQKVGELWTYGRGEKEKGWENDMGRQAERLLNATSATRLSVGKRYSTRSLCSGSINSVVLDLQSFHISDRFRDAITSSLFIRCCLN